MVIKACPKEKKKRHCNKIYDQMSMTSQQTFTFSKATIETLEKGVKYVQR